LGHNLPLAIIFVLLALFYLIKLFFYNQVKKLFKLCCACCSNKNADLGDSAEEKLPFIQLLSSDDLEDEILLLDFKMKKIQYEGFKSLMKDKQSVLLKELKRRNRIRNYRQDAQFVGLATYDVLLNPVYKQFTMNELEKDAINDV